MATCQVSSASDCELLVAGASDLSRAEQTLASAYRPCKLRFSFGSSGTLAQQIRAGADFDVFLAANEGYVDGLISAGAADSGTRVLYATGRLAVWSKSGQGWDDLKRVRHVAIANPVHAPYGLAARESLQSRGLWTAMSPKIVYAQSVRQALQFAESGNAEIALVSWSLVHDRGGVLVPAEWHRPIRQAGVVPKRARRPAEAREFLRWLVGPEGRKVLGAAGLGPGENGKTKE